MAYSSNGFKFTTGTESEKKTIGEIKRAPDEAELQSMQ